MNQVEFYRYMEEKTGESLGSEYEVTYQTVTLNNDVIRDQLMIERRNSCMGMRIDLEPFYDRYMENCSLSGILDELLAVYHRTEEMEPGEEAFHLLYDWTLVSERIGGRLVNAKENADRLQSIPHRCFLDLALIYDLKFADYQNSMSCSAVVNNTNVAAWGITEEDLYQCCCRNMPRMEPAAIYSMTDILNEMMLGEDADNLVDAAACLAAQQRDVVDPMYVLTTESRVNGAIAGMYSGVLDTFMDRMGWKCVYLIPSSIHELLILRAESAVDESRMQQMIREVNRDYVERIEVLSDSLYQYDRSLECITLVGRKEGLRQQILGVTIS